MHFVSDSGPCSVCFKPSNHKLGEEINPHDESCLSCGKKWISPELHPEEAEAARNACSNPVFHIFGPGSQRHNLTAAVCCFHYTMIVGRASDCPLTVEERNHLAYIRTYTNPDKGLENCHHLLSECCHAPMVFESFNTKNTLAFVACSACAQASVIDVPNKESK